MGLGINLRETIGFYTPVAGARTVRSWAGRLGRRELSHRKSLAFLFFLCLALDGLVTGFSLTRTIDSFGLAGASPCDRSPRAIR